MLDTEKALKNLRINDMKIEDAENQLKEKNSDIIETQDYLREVKDKLEKEQLKK